MNTEPSERNYNNYDILMLKIAFVCLIIHNFLYYLFIFSSPFDLIGILVIALLYFYRYYKSLQTNNMLIGIFSFFWVLISGMWRVLLLQNEVIKIEVIQNNSIIPELFLVGSLFLFLGLLFLLRELIVINKKNNFLRISQGYLFYITLNFILSVIISIGALIPTLNDLLVISLFIKIYIVSGIGLIIFSSIFLNLRKIKIIENKN